MIQNSKKGFLRCPGPLRYKVLGQLLSLLQPHLEQPAFFVDGFPVLINRRCFNLHGFIADAAEWYSQFAE
jgi:hypothetical protein